MTTNQIIKKYGQPNITGAGYLVHIDLPYPMKLAWDLNTTVTRISCHRLVADKFLAVFNDLLEQYTLAGIQQLGIDIYGGCFQYRKMKVGSSMSTHSWGISIDLDPARNLLRETHKTARFARWEYEPMIQIFEYHGFESLGKLRDMDWMHFQIKQ